MHHHYPIPSSTHSLFVIAVCSIILILCSALTKLEHPFQRPFTFVQFIATTIGIVAGILKIFFNRN